MKELEVWYLVEIIKKDEIINFNGYKFKCLIDELEIPKIISKQYLLQLCTDSILKEV